ncbi:hypothetical protein [Nocardia altamirensis]|uniref:hypothetical protein n=1 Tax=Nocardia TaxID=1817 RepID=UPI0008405DC0|nr:hypothetical protein [Nocardia altamirensis]
MFETGELRKAKRELLDTIDHYSWAAAKGEFDNAERFEACASGITFAAARYGELGGDVERLIRKCRSRVKAKFDAVEAEYCSRTGRLLFADSRRETDRVVESVVSIVRYRYA